MKTKKAFITGVTGQDGAYLTELLLEKGYEVHGMKRAISLRNTERIDHIYKDPTENQTSFVLHYGDLTDAPSLNSLIANIRPDEIYNLAAMSHVGISFLQPEYAAQVDGLGVVRILEAIRHAGLSSKARFYQASTSELYGDTSTIPQNELTPMAPDSPYAAAKHYAYTMTKLYREAYGLFACNGILFNHESPTRGENFVTRKITIGLAKIVSGQAESIFLGNLDSKRDWGHAKDYVKAQWLMLQQDRPDDYVISTNEQRSVREFATAAFRHVGVELTWSGQGVDEVGSVETMHESRWPLRNIRLGQQVIKISPDYFRPLDVTNLLGDSSKARLCLNWAPEHTFEQLVSEMVDADLTKHAVRCIT